MNCAHGQVVGNVADAAFDYVSIYLLLGEGKGVGGLRLAARVSHSECAAEQECGSHSHPASETRCKSAAEQECCRARVPAWQS